MKYPLAVKVGQNHAQKNKMEDIFNILIKFNYIEHN